MRRTAVARRKSALRDASPVLKDPVENPVDLRGTVSFRLLRIAGKLTQGFIQSYMSRFDVGLPEWRTLGMLGQFGPLPSIRIAELAQMDRGSISRAVAWLEQRDLVRRVDDPAHLRRKIVVMTAAGKRLHDRISVHVRARQRRILDLLSPQERAALDGILRKIDRWASELQAGAAFEGGPGERALRGKTVQAKPVPASLILERREKLLAELAMFKRTIELCT